MASTSSDSSPVLSGLSSDLDKTFVKGGLADDFKHFLDESVSSTESDEDKFNLSKRSTRQKLESALGGKSWLKTKPDLKSKPEADIGGLTSKPADRSSPIKEKVDIKSTDAKDELKSVVNKEIPQPSDDESDEDDDISEEIEQTDEVRWPLERALSNITEVTEGTEETSYNDAVKSSVSNEAYSEKFESSEDGGSGNEFDFEFGNVNSEGESVDAEIPVAVLDKETPMENNSQQSDTSSYDDSFEKSAEKLADSESSDNFNTNNLPPPESSKLDEDSNKLRSFSVGRKLDKPLEKFEERRQETKIQSNAVAVAKPNENKEKNITKPIEVKETAGKPLVKDKESMAQPIKDEESMSQPIKDEESMSQPIKDEEIMSQPIKDEESMSQPNKDEEIVSQPIKDKTIMSKSIEDDKIITKSIDVKEKSIVESIEDRESLVKSIKDMINSAIPIKEGSIDKPIEEKEKSIARPIVIKESVAKPLRDKEIISKPIEIKERSIDKTITVKTFANVPATSLKSSASFDIVKSNTNSKLIRSKSEDFLKSKPSTSALYPKTSKTTKDTPSLNVTTRMNKTPTSKSRTNLVTTNNNFKAPKKFENTVFARLSAKPNLAASSLFNATDTASLKEKESKIRSELLLTQFQKLKRDHQHLESLMKGYEEENIKLNEEVKKLKISSKNSQSTLLKEKRVSSFQLASLKEKVEQLESRKVEPNKDYRRDLKTPFEDENDRLKKILQETELSNQRLKEKIDELSEENVKLKKSEDSRHVLNLKINHLEKQLTFKQQIINQLEKEKEEWNKRLLFYQNLQITDGTLSSLENDIKKLFSEFEKKDSMTKETLKSLRDHQSALKAYSRVVSQLENQRIEMGPPEYSTKKVGCNVMLENGNTKSVGTQRGETNHGTANIPSRIQPMGNQLEAVLKNFKSSNWLESRYSDTEALNLTETLESERLRRKILEQKLSDTEKENLILRKENGSLKAASDRLNRKIESVLDGKPDELYIFLVLEKKIEELEKMYDERDSELSNLRDQLEEYTPFHMKEELLLTRELVLRKNKQLEQVRLELDSLIGLLTREVTNN